MIHCGYLYNIFLPPDNGQQDIAVCGIEWIKFFEYFYDTAEMA